MTEDSNDPNLKETPSGIAPPVQERPPVKEPTQTFVAKRNVIATYDSAEPGEDVDLTLAEYRELSPLGAIEGSWKRR